MYHLLSHSDLLNGGKESFLWCNTVCLVCRLDPVLYKKCQGDAARLCHTHGWNETSELMPPGAVFSCLYRHAYRTEEQGRRVWGRDKHTLSLHGFSFFFFGFVFGETLDRSLTNRADVCRMLSLSLSDSSISSVCSVTWCFLIYQVNPDEQVSVRWFT